MVRLHIRVEGRVQGVGFRWFTCAAAARLNLTGWVCNREDGSVEMEVQGPELPVEDFVQAVSRGPRYAAVEKLDRRRLELEEGERSFRERGGLW